MLEPSDAAAAADWTRFAIEDVARVLDASSAMCCMRSSPGCSAGRRRRCGSRRRKNAACPCEHRREHRQQRGRSCRGSIRGMATACSPVWTRCTRARGLIGLRWRTSHVAHEPCVRLRLWDHSPHCLSFAGPPDTEVGHARSRYGPRARWSSGKRQRHRDHGPRYETGSGGSANGLVWTIRGNRARLPACADRLFEAGMSTSAEADGWSPAS
jgi:hypothetical protein